MATRKKPVAPVDAAFAPVVKSFAKDGQVGLGSMFSSHAVLNVNGKVFAMLVRGRLVVKLPKARVDALVATAAAERFDPGHGRIMKEWASFPAEAQPEWIGWAKEAYAYVAVAAGAGRAAKPRNRPRPRPAR
jgi:TfoX/Sxy family transcriptional regulator of competence genes